MISLHLRLYLNIGLGSCLLAAPRASAIAPARRRGPGPRPPTSFEYNLRNIPSTNSHTSLTRDNMGIRRAYLDLKLYSEFDINADSPAAPANCD